MEEEEDFLKVLRALRDAARRVESGGGDCPALHALLALEASADDLLAGDPDLATLRRLLARIGALNWSIRFAGEGIGMVGYLRWRCRRYRARKAIATAAGAVAGEIQAWIDRENVARLVAALRRASAAAANAQLAELEARLAARFDPRLQRALLRHGVFAAVEERIGDSEVGDSCAAAVLALVRFNKDVFVGPVLMGRAVGALVAAAAASPAPLRALNGLVAAIRGPLVDELHARGELPRLVALLCSADARIRALALEFALRIGFYGRREIIESLLAEGLIKRLLCLQRSDLAGETHEFSFSSPEEKPKLEEGVINGVVFFAGILWCRRRREDEEEDDYGGGGGEAHRPFVSAVARFAVQVEVGEGLSQREKRAAKVEILRRVREAAVSPAEEATVLAEVLWGATP